MFPSEIFWRILRSTMLNLSFDTRITCLFVKTKKERKLALVKQIVSTDSNMAEETRDKLVSISSTDSYCHRRDSHSPRHVLLDSTSEIESSMHTRSILSSLDFSEKTDEDLELSHVRSVREVRPSIRVSNELLSVPAPITNTSSSAHHSKQMCRSPNPVIVESAPPREPQPQPQPQPPFNHLNVATATATAMASNDRQVRRSSSGKRALRPHNFASKVILKQEICIPCQSR